MSPAAARQEILEFGTAFEASAKVPFRATFEVRGVPKGQPRPRATIRGKHAGVYDPGTATNWKHAVILEGRSLRPSTPLEVPVCVSIEFHLPRPKRLTRRSDPAGIVWSISKPDIDNLAKAVLDALVQDGWFVDDSLIVELHARKVYHPKAGVPGARIEISEASSP